MLLFIFFVFYFNLVFGNIVDKMVFLDFKFSILLRFLTVIFSHGIDLDLELSVFVSFHDKCSKQFLKHFLWLKFQKARIQSIFALFVFDWRGVGFICFWLYIEFFVLGSIFCKYDNLVIILIEAIILFLLNFSKALIMSNLSFWLFRKHVLFKKRNGRCINLQNAWIQHLRWLCVNVYLWSSKSWGFFLFTFFAFFRFFNSTFLYHGLLHRFCLNYFHGLLFF